MSSGIFKQIKDQLDIVSVVSEYAHLKQVGEARYSGLCPIHNEDTPSFYVDSRSGLFYCFGCKAGGDVISFIEHVEGKPRSEIPDYVRKKYGLSLSDSFSKEERSSYSGQLRVLEEFKEFFFERNKEKAIEYMMRRLAGSDINGREREVVEKIVERYEIFFVDWEGSKKFISWLGDNQLLTYAYDLGITYQPKEHQASPYIPFVNRVVIPIKRNGSIVAFNGRAVGKKEPKYLLTKSGLVFKKTNTLFGLEEAIQMVKNKDKKTVYLVEGVMDALTLVSRGLPAVAYLGSSIHRNQYSLLTSAFNNIVILPDSDKGGSDGLIRSLETSITMGFPISGQVMFLPKSMDVNDFLKKYTVDDLKDLRITTFEDAFISYHIHKAQKSAPVPNATPNIISSIALQNILPKLMDYNTNPTSHKVLMRVVERFGLHFGAVQDIINRGISSGAKNIREHVSKTSFLKKAKLEARPVEVTMLGILQASPLLLTRLQEENWYIFTSVYFRDIAESFYMAEKEPNKSFSDILFERIGSNEEIIDKYLAIIMFIPTFTKELADEMFEQMLSNMASLFKKDEERARKAQSLLAASNAAKTLKRAVAKQAKPRRYTGGYTKEDLEAVLSFTEEVSKQIL